MKITGRHLVVTSALRRHVVERFERLEKYGVELDRSQVILGVNKLQHVAEAVCAVGRKRFQAKTATQEMYATIDGLVNRLDAQLRKYKDRRTEHKGKKRRALDMGSAADSNVEEIEVVRPKVAVLTRERAKDRLENRPGSLLFYTCMTTGKLQVLQRGENGQVVLIDP